MPITAFDIEETGLPFFYIHEYATGAGHGATIRIGPISFNPISQLGLSGLIIRRMVAQAVPESSYAYFGKSIDSVNESALAWILEKILPGQQITRHPTGQVRLVLVWHGMLTYSMGHNGLNYKLQSPIADTLPLAGERDPIPDVRLYGNPRIPWTSGPGGKDLPGASGWYDGEKKSLTAVPSKPKKELLNQLLNR